MVAMSGAGAWITMLAMPSGSGRRETYRSARARRWRCAAPSGSTAITARPVRRRTATTVMDEACGSTRCSTSRATSGVQVAVPRTIAAAFGSSINPADNAARVPGVLSRRCSASPSSRAASVSVTCNASANSLARN
jgi:hypothetical protein